VFIVIHNSDTVTQ